LMTRITNDIDALTDMVTRGVVSIFGDIAMVVLISGAMLILDCRPALVAFLSLPILIALAAYFRGIMRESCRAIRIRLARVNAFLNETLSGMAIVQLFTREKPVFDAFDSLNRDLLAANQGQVRAMSVFQPTVNFTRNATAALLFVVGANWVLDSQLSLGTLVAFWQLLQNFFQPILDDGVDIRDMSQADVRRHVGVVLQDPFIFAGTISSNIRLNETAITDEQVRAAARFVNADKFVERLPQGYETVVTERGSTLS